jgi:hypothetical protein
MPILDWDGLSPEEWAVEWDAAQAQSIRRWTLETGEQQQSDLNKRYLEAIGRAPGDVWVQPTGALDAYPIAAQVTHGGKEWVSLVGGNTWEPGVSGWREAGNEWPDWVQPTGAHDAYDLGAQVTHEGKRWISTLAANVWVPGQAGWDVAA